MVSIPGLTEQLNPAQTDDMVIETAAGTRRATLANALIRHSQLTLLTPANVNVASDRFGIFDATDGRLKGMTAFNAIFGNFGNVSQTDGFTLDPTIHNVRPIECTGSFVTTTITLDGTTPDQGGAVYNIHNLTAGDLTLAVAGGITMYDGGVSVASATISRRTSAAVWVRDNNLEAIFSGG